MLTIKDILLTSRPFWWITTSAPFVLGYWTGQPAITAVLIIGALYFIFPYNLFLYGVNDIFDYESDIRNPRKAGIEGAVLAKSKHRPLATVILAFNLPFWLYFLAVGDPAARLWLGLIIFMALAYSIKYLRFKEVPVLDSFTSAFHYTSPFMLGVLLSGGRELYLPIYAAFYIWSMSNHAFGAIQDIKPDREAGIASIATRLGASRVVRLCLAGYTLAAILPAALYGIYGLLPAMLLTPYIGLVAATWPYRHKSNHPIFHRHWQFFTYLNYAVGAALTIYLIAIAYY